MRPPVDAFDIAADRTHARVFDACSYRLEGRLHEFSNRLVPNWGPVIADPHSVVQATIQQLHQRLGQRSKYARSMQQVCVQMTPLSAAALFIEGILLPEHFRQARYIKRGSSELLQLPPIILGGHIVHPYVSRRQRKLQLTEGDLTM